MHRVFFEASDWVYKLMKVNMLWFVGVMTGFGILGLMPATTAMVSITRKWSNGQLDVPIWKTFWKTYKASFKTSNIVGFWFVTIIAILLVNLRLTVLIPGTLMMITHYFILFVLLLVATSFILFFQLYAQYEFTIKEYLFQSPAFLFSSPLAVAAIMIGCGCVAWLLYQMPGFIPFFSVVLPAYWSSTVCKKQFRKIEQREIIVGK